ncbi:MAG: hypothetical protein AAFX75_14570 [Pseudomonadota bacterium]
MSYRTLPSPTRVPSHPLGNELQRRANAAADEYLAQKQALRRKFEAIHAKSNCRVPFQSGECYQAYLRACERIRP